MDHDIDPIDFVLAALVYVVLAVLLGAIGYALL